MEKYTLQSFIEVFAKQSGLSKKTAEALSKAFFDTIAEGLTKDGVVKINGFGTFRIVDVADRESVNVNNGERILIAGYKKVSFVPADMMVMEQPKPEGAEIQESENVDSVPEVQLSQPEIEEGLPLNEFAGIDLLISSPESLEDIRQQYEAAKVRAAETLKQANEANAELIRIERLMRRMESLDFEDEKVKGGGEESLAAVSGNGGVMLSEEMDLTEKEDASPKQDVTSFEENKVEEKQDAVPASEEKGLEKRANSWMWWLLIPLLGILLAFVAIFVYKNYYAEDGKQPVVEQKKHPEPKKVKEKVRTDTAKAQRVLEQGGEKVPAVVSEKQETKRERPRTYVMQPGESLTRISQKFYGTKDSVRAIIRINRFANPDNVPVGAEVRLP